MRPTLLRWSLCSLLFLFFACKKTADNSNGGGNPNNGNPGGKHSPGLYFNYDGKNSGFIGQAIFDSSMIPADIVVSIDSLSADSAVYFYWNSRAFLTKTADVNGRLNLLVSDFSGSNPVDGDVLVLLQGKDTLRALSYKPYYIGSWQDLQAMRRNLTGHYSLMSDVVLPDPGTGRYPATGFEPIGHIPQGPVDLTQVKTVFTGSFQGNGHTISHLNCRVLSGETAGLFGFVSLPSGQKISNFTISQRSTDSVVNYSPPTTQLGSGYEYAGTAIGYLQVGVIDSIQVQGGGVRTSRALGEAAGGIAGIVSFSQSVNQSAPSIQNSSASCGVDSYWSGGLVGYNTNSRISNCFATGSISGGNAAGGLIGYANGARGIDRCHATGSVFTDVTGTYTGGLLGLSYGDSVTNSYATGNVVSKGIQVVNPTYQPQWGTGGLIGVAHSVILNCYATGNVTSDGGVVGGLFGAYIQSITTVDVLHCFSTGTVKGHDDAGGLAGYASSLTAMYCFSSSNVTGGNATGGLLGSIAYSTCTNCYAIGNVHGANGVGGLSGSGFCCIVAYYGGDSVVGSGSVGYVTAVPGGTWRYYPCNYEEVVISGSQATDMNNSSYSAVPITISGYKNMPIQSKPGALPSGGYPFDGFDFINTWYWNPGNWPTLRNMPTP